MGLDLQALLAGAYEAKDLQLAQLAIGRVNNRDQLSFADVVAQQDTSRPALIVLRNLPVCTIPTKDSFDKHKMSVKILPEQGNQFDFIKRLATVFSNLENFPTFKVAILDGADVEIKPLLYVSMVERVTESDRAWVLFASEALSTLLTCALLSAGAGL